MTMGEIEAKPAGSRSGFNQNRTARAAESTTALMARHLMVLITTLPRARARVLSWVKSGFSMSGPSLRAKGADANKLPQDGPAANRALFAACGRRYSHGQTMS